jgi:AraC-like DNA-binding protein
MSTATLPDRAAPLRLEGRSVEGAETLGAAVFHPHRVRPLGDPIRFRLGIEAVSVGDITVGTIEYTRPARIDTGPYDDSYQVNLPLEGTLRTAMGDARLRASASTAAVYRRDVPTALEGFENGQRVLALKVGREALERRLRELGGEPGPGGIRFDPALDVTSAWGRVWKWHLDIFARQLSDPGILLTHPILAGAVLDGLMTSLLFAASHPDRDALSEFSFEPRIPPSAVEQVADLMRASPELSFTTGMLAELTGTSARAVQLGFRKRFGQSPYSYLQQIRLHRVRAELLDGDPHRAIADIAKHWGFGHAGRFSAAYARAFGEQPHATQRPGRPIH